MRLHRKLLRALLPAQWLNCINHWSHLEQRLYDLEARCARLAQLALRECYSELFTEAASPDFGIFSQNDEDGVLLRILKQAGTEHKTFAEIGIENARECNTAILAFVLGWSGLMVDRDALGVAAARRLVRQILKEKADRVQLKRVDVNRDNVNTLLGGYQWDVLSIDVDGMDYWLWEALQSTAPRVVVIEYNASFGAERSITVPYSSRFDARSTHPSGYYHGASLAALEKLARRKGYGLVATCHAGVNAFFVREDARPKSLPALTAAEAFRPHAARCRVHTPQQQWELIRHLPYVEV